MIIKNNENHIAKLEKALQNIKSVYNVKVVKTSNDMTSKLDHLRIIIQYKPIKRKGNTSVSAIYFQEIHINEKSKVMELLNSTLNFLTEKANFQLSKVAKGEGVTYWYNS